MPQAYLNNGHDTRHTESIQDIITAAPSWLLKWGITVFFSMLLLGIALCVFIRYPDIVKAPLKISSPNAPKPVVARVSGKLAKLLISENQVVVAGQPLAYIESTANHTGILKLLENLQLIQQQVLRDVPLSITPIVNQAKQIQLGELQSAYQTFYGEYLNYQTAENQGFLLKKRSFLKKDLSDINLQQKQLNAQVDLEKRDLELATQQYNIAKQLYAGKVLTSAEFRQEESKYLAKKTPLMQTQASIINNYSSYTGKQKEIAEVDNNIQQAKLTFLQALNGLISTANDWKSKYILTASVNGKVSYTGIIQENETLQQGQEVFYINPGDSQFFGEMAISQLNIGKVKVGQKVLIKLKGYPYQEFGIVNGSIKSIADIPYKDSVFMSRVDFKIKTMSDIKKKIYLKQGMTADAEIITQDATVFQRICWSLLKINH